MAPHMSLTHVTSHVSGVHPMMAHVTHHVHMRVHMGIEAQIRKLLRRKRVVHVILVMLLLTVVMQVLLQGGLLIDTVSFPSTIEKGSISGRTLTVLQGRLMV